MSSSINAQYKGAAGENRVAQLLSGFNRRKFIVLNNVMLRKPIVKNGDVSRVQVDHVLISVYGIFSIETKNYTGKVYGSDENKTWCYYLAGQKYSFANPLRQNYGHFKVLQQLIGSHAAELGILDVPYPSFQIVAFSNRADLSKVQANKAFVVNFDNVVNAILNKCTKQYLSVEQMENIAKFIAQQNIYTPQEMQMHIDEINRLKGPDVRNESMGLYVGNINNQNNSFAYAPVVVPAPITNYPQFISDEDINYRKVKSKLTTGDILMIIAGVVVIIVALAFMFLLFFGGLLSALIKSSAEMNYSDTSQVVTQSTTVNNNQQPEPVESEPIEILPDEVDITDTGGIIVYPREDVTNGVVYICHGSSKDVDEISYTDDSGIEYEDYILMYYHNVWAEAEKTYIDIAAKSYNTLSFDFYSTGEMFWDYTELSVQVIDNESGEVLFESENVKVGQTQHIEVDITGRDSIRLLFIDAHNGACYGRISNLILKDLAN